MHWQTLDTWIVVAGALSAVSCALLGNFLVLRRASMMGDAISHAVLPGLALAFLITDSRDSIAMFVGAGVVGVLTAVMTQWVHRVGRVDPSASMGVVFTGLFALGLILIVRGADHVDLDPGCVLYGAIELTPLDTVFLGGWDVPRAVVILAVVFVINALFVAVFFKELRISSFDPQLSTTVGINATVMHHALMVLVAITAVASFESVGSILVIAMLIVPAASAQLLTDRLGSMVLVSAAIAVASAVLGHAGAMTVPGWFGFEDTSTAGMIAVAAGVMFAVTWVAAPRQGLVGKLLHRVMVRLRVLQEDILGVLYRLEEYRGGEGAGLSIAKLGEVLALRPAFASVAIRGLVKRGEVTRTGHGYGLTRGGREAAARLVRAHRLWESYLVKFLNLPPDHVHGPAERLEHVTDAAMHEALADRTDRPEHDPQGRAIPPSP